MTSSPIEKPADFTPEDLEEFRHLIHEVEEEDSEPNGDELEEEEDDEDPEAPDEDLAALLPPQNDDLDALWREVSTAAPHRRRPERDVSAAAEQALRRMREAYTRPENWRRIRGVALMHKDSQTLLGNFSEYLHADGRSRKFLRDTALLPVEGVIEVEGTWWLDPLAREHVEAAKHWQTQRSITAPCHLDKLGVFCPATPLLLFMQFGGIMRVELAADCTFASANGSTVMQLARGVNVYECMDHEGKVALRQHIIL